MQTRQTLTDNQLRPLSFSMFLPTFFHATKLDRIVVDAYSSANAKQRAVFCTSSLSQIKNTINHLFHEITLTSAS